MGCSEKHAILSNEFFFRKIKSNNAASLHEISAQFFQQFKVVYQTHDRDCY